MPDLPLFYPDVGVYRDECFNEITTLHVPSQSGTSKMSITHQGSSKEVYSFSGGHRIRRFMKGDTVLFTVVGDPAAGEVVCEDRRGKEILKVHSSLNCERMPSRHNVEADAMPLRTSLHIVLTLTTRYISYLSPHRPPLHSRDDRFGDASEIFIYPNDILATIDRCPIDPWSAGRKYEIKIAPGVDTAMIAMLCVVFDAAIHGA
ncbi:uncharacterized protein EHS24_007038 [Apiotrichum porosum]|uniref:Uncharacterized protein n=1 Tax=Apiotrichum porosum TaxID=105984 RepID=A0A427XWZ1_9TREE|nr:uncharacterized protein EHS24_007038 [Apiotrichum porosum]RSH83360.1 hypothetical protein EHS24_007038 [Apiotrichum porosum]